MAGTRLMNVAKPRRLLTGFGAVAAYTPKIPAKVVRDATIILEIILALVGSGLSK